MANPLGGAWGLGGEERGVSPCGSRRALQKADAPCGRLESLPGVPMPRWSLHLPLLLVGCASNDGSLSDHADEYVDVRREVAAADRDTTRNVRNKEARARKVKAERARVAFFQKPALRTAIQAGLAAAEGSEERALALALERKALLARSWTQEDKDEEIALLARLEERRGTTASWVSPDGAVEVSLEEGFFTISRELEDRPESEREDLAQELVDHRMQLVGETLQELVALRNRVAVREGYSNYWELGLAARGLTPQEVTSMVADLSEVVAPANAAMDKRIEAESASTGLADSWANEPALRRSAGLSLTRDKADSWFDTDLAESQVTTAFQDMGFSTRGWQVFSGPRRYVRPGAYAFPLDPPDDVAIVISKDRRWSVWQAEALAHEGGFLLWWTNLDESRQSHPTLWEPPSPWFEGFAQFFERQVFTEAFAERYVPEMPAHLRTHLVQWRLAHLAEGITDAIVRTEVERRLYDDPTNLAAVARHGQEVRERLTGRPPPPVSDKGMPYADDLLSPILWNYPAYSQNYLFAYVTEAALDDAVTAKVGAPVGNEKVGPLLVEQLVRAPVTVPFRDRLVALVGSDDIVAPLRDDLKPVEAWIASASGTAEQPADATEE